MIRSLVGCKVGSIFMMGEGIMMMKELREGQDLGHVVTERV
jgi:hypothetical protein